MHFFDRYLEEHFPEKLLFGGIYSSLVLITSGMVVSLLYLSIFAGDRDWAAFGAGVACIVGAIGLIVGMVVRFQRTGALGRIPAMCLAAALLSTIAIGFVGISTHAGVLVALTLVLPVTAAGLFGDVTTLIGEWVVAVAVATWSLAVQGIDRVVPTVVVAAVVFAGIELAIGSIMRFLAQNMRLSEMFRHIDGLIDEGMTYAEALEASLNRVAASGRDVRAIVLVGEAELGFAPLLTWPSSWTPEDDLDGLGRDADVLAVARTGVTKVRPDFAIMTVGFIEEGVVVVLLKRTARGLFATVNELPYDVVAVALSQVSLRVNSLRRLKSLGNTDPLTGLFNRRVLMERLALEMDHVERDAHPLCVAMIDLDHFMRYNDTFGHLAGDEVLHEIAAVFTQRLRKQDSAARYGGEEFCLVLPDTTLPDGVRLADELREAVGDMNLLGPVSFSAGIARHEPGETIAQLIGRADAALYDAKNHGRNMVAAAEATDLASLRNHSTRTD